MSSAAFPAPFDGETFFKQLMPVIATISKEKHVDLTLIESNFAKITSPTGEKFSLDARYLEVLSEAEAVFSAKYSSITAAFLRIIFACFKGKNLSYEETFAGLPFQRSQTLPSLQALELQNKQIHLLIEISQFEKAQEKLLPEIEQTRAKIAVIQGQRSRGNKSGTNSHQLLNEQRELSRQTAQIDRIKKKIEASKTELIVIKNNLFIPSK